MMDQSVSYAQPLPWKIEIIFFNAISVLGYGTIFNFFGQTVMTWCRLLCKQGRSLTNLSLWKWSSWPCEIFGKWGMIRLSDTSDHLSGNGEMGLFMILHFLPIESRANTEAHSLDGLISYLLEFGTCTLFAFLFQFLSLFGGVFVYTFCYLLIKCCGA